ncbi:phage tail protein, partial [Enterococcus faecium]
MASVSFHHGTRVFESAETPLLVRMARTAVIGLIGTAPNADVLAFPLNKPV